MSESKAKEKALEALKLVGLEDKLNENPYDLGLSERKLIAIASIVAMDTDIIILDEPTIAQDYVSKEKIKSIIHDMDFVAECFERTIVLAKGKVLLDGPTKEVFSKEDELKAAYLEPPHIAQLCKALGYKETYLSVEAFVADLKQVSK